MELKHIAMFVCKRLYGLESIWRCWTIKVLHRMNKALKRRIERACEKHIHPTQFSEKFF